MSKQHIRPFLKLKAASLVLAALSFGTASAQPVQLTIHTSNGTDTSYMGVPLQIVFHLDASADDSLAAINIPLALQFSSGNIMGPIMANHQLFISQEAQTFSLQPRGLVPAYLDATDPDTIFIAFLDGGPPYWSGAAELCRIDVLPLDTGDITFTDIALPPANELSAFDRRGVTLPLEWNSPTIVVEPCPSDLMGDVDATGMVNSADAIYLVQYLFKGGPQPLPTVLAGDADCSRGTTAADVIGIVNYIFKSGPPPCPCSNENL